MLNDSDLHTSVDRVAERVLDTASYKHGPIDGLTVGDASALEGLAWNRFFRLANLAFRQSHMGLGTIMGYKWGCAEWKRPTSLPFPRGFAVVWLPRQFVDG